MQEAPEHNSGAYSVQWLPLQSVRVGFHQRSHVRRHECHWSIVPKPRDLDQALSPYAAVRPTGLRTLLHDRRRAVGSLAFSSGLGGVVEALFLVSITRAAFAITDSKERFTLVGSWEVGVRMAVSSAWRW